MNWTPFDTLLYTLAHERYEEEQPYYELLEYISFPVLDAMPLYREQDKPSWLGGSFSYLTSKLVSLSNTAGLSYSVSLSNTGSLSYPVSHSTSKFHYTHVTRQNYKEKTWKAVSP